MALQLLKAMGGKGAIVVDIDEAKREAALRAGALDTVDAHAADALQQVTAKVGGAAAGGDRPCWLRIDGATRLQRSSPRAAN